MTKRRKKSLVGWTYSKWKPDFRWGKWGDENKLAIPEWILKSRQRMTGLKRVRITIEEL